MRGWIEGIQKIIDFMEQNLTQALEIEAIAEKAALSLFYDQRIFGALCGMTVGEYVRARRMTLAAQELSRKDARVIDVELYLPPMDGKEEMSVAIWVPLKKD